MHNPISKKFLAVKHIDMIKTPTKNQANISKRLKVIPFLNRTHTAAAAATTTTTPQGVEL